jgi:hypothetical protein
MGGGGGADREIYENSRENRDAKSRRISSKPVPIQLYPGVRDFIDLDGTTRHLSRSIRGSPLKTMNETSAERSHVRGELPHLPSPPRAAGMDSLVRGEVR